VLQVAAVAMLLLITTTTMILVEATSRSRCGSTTTTTTTTTTTGCAAAFASSSSSSSAFLLTPTTGSTSWKKKTSSYVRWGEPFAKTGSFVATSTSSRLHSSSIKDGDKIVIVGGTSGVGQLVTKKLAAAGKGYDLKVASRNVEKAKSSLGDGVDVAEVDLTGGIVEQQLRQAFDDDTNAIVICVGTTAFPTLRWRGGNTPSAIDRNAVKSIAKVASTLDALKKIVMVTSVGVDRTSEMPFLVLNLFGVLDAKKDGENAIIEASKQSSKNNFSYVIVRPGRLVGGPFTNLDVANLLKIQGGAYDGVDLARGDALLGDCSRDACAEAVVRALTSDDCNDVDFSIISNPDKKPLTPQQWNDEFKKLKVGQA